MPVVVIGPAADKVAIDDTGFIDKSPAANFQIKTTLLDGCHFSSAYAIGIGRNLNSMTDAGDRFVLFKKVLRHTNQVRVVTNVFGRATSGEEDANVLRGVDLREWNIALNRVAFPFPGDRPARFYFMQNHRIQAFFRCGNDGLKTPLPEDGKRGTSCQAFLTRPR